MKTLILLILSFNIILADIYKPKFDDGREIEIKQIDKKRIEFIIKYKDKTLLQGKAYDKYGGVETDSEECFNADFGEICKGYVVIEYHSENECEISLRVQDETLDKNDKQKRLSLRETLNCELLKDYFLDEKEKFYLQNEEKF